MAPDIVNAFANDLLKSLDTNAEPKITNTNIQCSGTTKTLNRCKNQCNINCINEDDVPHMFCTTHCHQDDTKIDHYNLVIEELPNNKHTIKEISSTHAPTLDFIECYESLSVDRTQRHSSTEECYATLKYNKKGDLDYQDVITKGPLITSKMDLINFRKNLICDIEVFISKSILVTIFYIKKVGRLNYDFFPPITKSALIESNIETKLQFIKTDTCDICFDEKDLYSLGCDAKHSFCTCCISKLYKKEIKCPLCRSSITSLDSIVDKLNIFGKQLSSPSCFSKTYTFMESDKILVVLNVNNIVVSFCFYDKNLAESVIKLFEHHLLFTMINDTLCFAISNDLLFDLLDSNRDESELSILLQHYLEENTT